MADPQSDSTHNSHPTPGWGGWLMALLPLAIFGGLLSLLPEIWANGAVQASLPWVPQLGIHFSFYIDGLSVLFGLIITGVGALIMIYAGGYMAGDYNLPRLFALLNIFMLAMLGVVTAGNLISLFIFWELTSVSSFMLIGFKHKEQESRDSALQALLVTGGGGLALMAGMLLIGLATGTFELGELLTQDVGLTTSPFYGAILILVLAGAFTKSAQVPFHFWLPGAMAAPTPVSAYLHSATMVKAGIYLMLRLSPLLGGTDAWLWGVGGAGALTTLIGAFYALHQTDLKRILAYSTLSILGMLTALIGVGSKLALEAALLMVLAHSLYKGALFLVAGIIDHETGTRDITRLGGLMRAMPMTFVGALIAGLSMAGVPLLFGFLSKEVTYEALFGPLFQGNSDLWMAVFAGVAFLVKTWMVAVALLLVVGGFWGPARDLPHQPHEPHYTLWLGPVVLGILSVAFGVYPALIDGPLISPALSAVYGTQTVVALKLWHGFTPILWLSLATLTLGALLYPLRRLPFLFTQPLEQLGAKIGPRQGYLALLNGALNTAKQTALTIQDRPLSGYVSVIAVLLVVFAGGGALLGLLTGILRLPPFLPPDQQLRWYEFLPPILIILSSFAVIRLRSRLKAIITLGSIGFGVVLIYIVFGAPDLAMTQLAVETLVIILFVLIVYRLPQFGDYSRDQNRWLHRIIAGLFGVTITLLVLLATGAVHPLEVSQYYAENSYLLAFGRNVVNVILVDFRGFDTMGEITVLAIAGIGVYALLKLKPKGDS